MRHTRRQFLAAGALAAGAIATSRARADKVDGSSRFGGFRLGLQSYSLRAMDRDAAVKGIHDLGLVAVEFYSRHLPPESPPAEIDALKAKLASLGIKMMGHGVNAFGKDHAQNRRWFELAKRAGIRNISADPAEDSFDSLDKLVAEYNIRIAIHNHGPGARYDRVADVLTAIKGRHPLIGACADLGHYIRSNEDPVRAIHLFEGRLFGVHLKDFAERKAKAAGTILGKGQLDVVGAFRALREVKFPHDGCLSVEYEEHPDNPMPDLKQCVAIAAEAAVRSSKG